MESIKLGQFLLGNVNHIYRSFSGASPSPNKNCDSMCKRGIIRCEGDVQSMVQCSVVFLERYLDREDKRITFLQTLYSLPENVILP